jgi:hypothetical protein
LRRSEQLELLEQQLNILAVQEDPMLGAVDDQVR